MLLQLNIKNFATIENMVIDFDKGLSVVTGSTGAGKSVFLEAINLVFGKRMSKFMVRQNTQKAEINAVFDINNSKNIQNWLQKNDFNNEDNICILRRVISKDGVSKSYINSVVSPTFQLQDLAQLFIEIYSQNSHIKVINPSYWQNIVDENAKHKKDVVILNSIRKKIIDNKKKIAIIKEQNANKNDEKELITYQLQELEEANISQEELDNIESDYTKSTKIRTIVQDLTKIFNQLDCDSGINENLLENIRILEKNQEVDNNIKIITNLINQSQIHIQESIYEINDYFSKANSDQKYINDLSQRIDILNNLSYKHKVPIKQLLIKYGQLQWYFVNLEKEKNQLEKLEKNNEKLIADYYDLAYKIRKKRADVSIHLSKKITVLLKILGMEKAKFNIKLKEKIQDIHLDGLENIEFYININEDAKDYLLHQVISGGELSRFCLALSLAAVDKYLQPLLVFDEVDTGISGHIANIIAQKLKKLAKKCQIICVTHSAQVASVGDNHFHIFKKNNISKIKLLVANTREQEIAQMLSGNISDKTILLAKEMLQS